MNARETELVALFQQHFDLELAGDVEGTLASCTDDIVYEHPFRLDRIQGLDAVRHYYTTTWSARPFHQLKFVRHWLVGEDTLAVEVDTRYGVAGGGEEHVRTICFGTFRNGKLAHEIVYSGPPIPQGK
jgi:hypothetical protein